MRREYVFQGWGSGPAAPLRHHRHGRAHSDEGSLLQLTTLGATDLRDQDGEAIRELLAQPKRIALLICLAVEGRRGPVPRDRLLGLFWPESDETRARNTLSQALHHLRQALGADVIESHGATSVTLRPGAVACDAVAFADAIDRGDMDAALDLYRGDFCPTLFVTGTPDVEQWLDTERRRMRTQALRAARAVAESSASRGDDTGAARAARRALAMEPDDEADVRALMSVLERAGDATGALVAYQEFARRLAATIEAEPSSQTRSHADAIRRRREAAPRDRAPDATNPAAPELDAVAAGAGASLPVPAMAGEPLPIVAPPPRRLRRPAVVGGLALASLLVASVVALNGRDRAAASAVRTIAVLPFTLRGGTPLGYLREGMVDLLSAKLGDAAGLHVIDPRSVVAAAASDTDRSSGADAALARRLGAGWFIRGDVTEVAGRLQLSGALYSLAAPATPVATGTVTGDTAALFELVDGLTGRMLAGMLGGGDTVLVRLAAVTTQSLPALKAFLEGERALRAGRDAQAAESYRVAANLDTTFALAQYRLALLATWVTVPDAENPTAWAATATRHADKLSPLGRDLLNAYRAYKEARALDSEQRYREITVSHPDNVDAWLMLGETRFHYTATRGRSPIDARIPFSRALALEPGNAHALIHLARLAAWDGRVVELDSLARQFQFHSRDAARALEMRALQAYVRDDPEERAAIIAAARDADDRVFTDLIQSAAVFAHNLDAVRELVVPFLRGTRDPMSRFAVERVATDVGVASGQWSRERAMRWGGPGINRDWLLETEVLLASDPVLPLPRGRLLALRDSVAARARWPLLVRNPQVGTPDVSRELRPYLGGLLDVRLGDTAAAARTAAELLATSDSARGASARQLGHALRAELARARGDLAGALSELQNFEFAVSASWGLTAAHWGVRERLATAELLHGLGRDEEALPWYESFLYAYDLPWVAITQLRQGQIHERLGHRERAMFHYERFLAMWRDADPELQPYVRQAHEALGRLSVAAAAREGKPAGRR